MQRLFLLFILVTCSTLYSQDKEPIDYVDPFLGTSSSRWMLYPGPSMPFGMVKLSPDNMDEWTMDAGYEYSIESISGFGFVHSWMMGSFLTMPTIGKIKILPGTKDNPDLGYRSRYSHMNETATPGYYSVLLEDYNILAELTSTIRTGIQRYTFPKTDSAHIIIDLCIPEEKKPTIIEAKIEKINNNEIVGYVKRKLLFNEYTLHFVSKLNHPIKDITGWKENEIIDNISSVYTDKNIDIGAVLNFSTYENQEIILKTGISYVSIEQARLNLQIETEKHGWDFDIISKNAQGTWNEILSRIEIEGGSENNKIKFYTNLYRAYCARSIFSDANGKYVDMCENIQQLENPNSPVYGCDAFWNTFWNLNQLWGIITPDIYNKWVNSLLEIYDKGGWLPKGPAGVEYSGVMVASHEIPFIVGAFQKGIRNYDVSKAFNAIKEIQTKPGEKHRCSGYVGNHNIASYLEMGYVPTDDGHVSNTLEYAYDDWCVAQMAKSLNKFDDYKYFMNRSQYYKNVFDPVTKFVRPKYIGGPWIKEFIPIVKAQGKEDNFGGKDFVEGNSWQYSFFVPHNTENLINIIGKEEFNNRLNEGLKLSRPRFVSNYVNHSNQPNMQAAWLFNHSNKPWLTQKWVREILDNYYGIGPLNGYPGDEDQGQMSAWFVMSAIGLFQMDGGASVNPTYEISSPLFDKVTIQLDESYYTGKEFVIIANNNSSNNKYIQSAKLNGKNLNKYWFYHSEFSNGGLLELEMGAEPNKTWAINSHFPIDVTEPIVTTPYVKSNSKLFLTSSKVELVCDTKDSEIYYTLDGSKPSINSILYNIPFIVEKSTKVRMVAFSRKNKSLESMALLNKAVYEENVKVGSLEGGVNYKYYKNYDKVKIDLVNLKPVTTSRINCISIKNLEHDNYFAFEFDGLIKISKKGLYTFYLASNDGSKLELNNKLIINNDGEHATIERNKTIALKKGYYPINVKYFQSAGSKHFHLKWEGPEIEKSEIPESVLFIKKDNE